MLRFSVGPHLTVWPFSGRYAWVRRKDVSGQERSAAVFWHAVAPRQHPAGPPVRPRRDAGVSDDTFDMVIVAGFDSADDHAIYRDHPCHRTLIEMVTRPIIAAA